MNRLIIAALALASFGAAQAQTPLLTPKGSKATLTIEWSYEAAGAKKDKYDPRTWKVNRSLQMTAQFVADKPQELAQMRALETEQLADMKNKQTTALKAAQKMEPTMNDMLKIVEKCGESEACIEKEIEAYGNSMQLTPELKSAGDDIKELGKTSGPRYQVWRAVSQKGTYATDEYYTGQTADPACMEKPKQRCNREETRKGSGDIPAAPGKESKSGAGFEVDARKKDIVMMLPVPTSAMPCARVVKSDFPSETEGARDSSCHMPFSYGLEKNLTITIPGDLKTLTGTNTAKLPGAEGEGGTATFKWTLTFN